MAWKQIIAVVLLLIFILSCQQHRKEDVSSVDLLPLHIQKDLDSLPANDVNALINVLNSNSALENQYIGFNAEPSLSYAYYEQLERIASDSIFLRLTYHENPKMRVYGMWGLSEKNHTLAIEQLERFFQDTSQITQTSGCITMTLPIYYIATSKIDSAILAQNSPKSFKAIKL